MILQTGDPSLVTVEGPHKLARAGGPHLDGPVSTGRHDVLLVKINYVHSRSEIIEVITRLIPTDDLAYRNQGIPRM